MEANGSKLISNAGATAPLAYSPEEAAKASSLGRTKIFQAISQKRLEAKKDGARTIILAADLETYLKSLPSARDAVAV